MNKKGFTLIEVLISIMIFGILLTSVLSSYVFSFRLFKNCDSKTFLQLYSNDILSDFKRKEPFEIENIYESGLKNALGVTGCFISFNDKTQLNTELKSLAFNKLIQSGSLEECRSQNSVKRYTAFCGLKKNDTIPDGFEGYTLMIRIIENSSIDTGGVENEKDFIFSK